MQYLVEFNHNWADECDVHGLAIMDEKLYNTILKFAKNATYYFGTNEGWEDEDLTEGLKVLSNDPSFIADIAMVLSFSEYNGYQTWGNFPHILDAAYERAFKTEYSVTSRSDGGYDVHCEGVFVGWDADMSKAYDIAHQHFVSRHPEFSS